MACMLMVLPIIPIIIATCVSLNLRPRVGVYWSESRRSQLYALYTHSSIISILDHNDNHSLSKNVLVYE